MSVLQEERFAFEGAVERDDLDEVKRVLGENPAYWDYKAVDGSTVIGIAIANGSVEVTRFLLENGVDADCLLYTSGRNQLRGAIPHEDMFSRSSCVGGYGTAESGVIPVRISA